MKIHTNVAASVMRYLYENLEIPHGVKIFEDVYSQDFENFTEWVVIDELSSRLGAQPKKNYFFHISQHKNAPRAADALARLVDTVSDLFEEGTEFNLYDYDTGEIVGVITVSNASLGPVLQHKGGGSYRSLSVGIVYQGK